MTIGEDEYIFAWQLWSFIVRYTVTANKILILNPWFNYNSLGQVVETWLKSLTKIWGNSSKAEKLFPCFLSMITRTKT